MRVFQLACWLVLICQPMVTSAERPNIIVILADDLGYSDLGCYGGELGTPHIDALANGGVRFTQMYNSARCCPTRASLLTGLHPSQAGIGDFTSGKPNAKRGPGYIGRLNDNCATIAEVLGQAGYGCYYVGKWHVNHETGPIRRGFDEFFGYTRGHSQDQFDSRAYQRLPQGRRKEIDPPSGEFYATDVFNDYAIEFIRQGQDGGKPWFLFLGHSSPHFPVQAPAERADKHEETYMRGWDVLREERFERMKQIGLVDGERWQLSERSIVPVDRKDIANGYPGKPNPAWNTLDSDRQRDLARRMSVYAAMVEAVDEGVGRIRNHLADTGDLDNTLILFLSDNGACYEWGPFGFDGRSRKGTTTLRTGEDLRKTGGPGTHQSYGSAWANLCNTPFRLYKHFTHEGGISTPFIAHWPKKFGKQPEWVRDAVHVMDVMPTLLSAAGVRYPQHLRGNQLTPLEGVDLLPAMNGGSIPKRTIGFDHQAAHAFREGNWKLVWSKRMPEKIEWELYDLDKDRCELHDLSKKFPGRVSQMATAWEQWARRVGVIWNKHQSKEIANEVGDSPLIANRSLEIEAEVQAANPQGVVMAHGGNQCGYSLHFVNGCPVFEVRLEGKSTEIRSSERVSGRVHLSAKLDASLMSLSINGGEAITTASPGLITKEPLDTLDVGYDGRTSAGSYKGPNRFNGEVIHHALTALPTSQSSAQDTRDGKKPARL